jgi:hypothetical protein
MKLNNSQITALVNYLGELTARDLERAHLLDVFTDLVNFDDETGVFIVMSKEGPMIEAIKTIRIVTGLGLKDAKDLFLTLNPNSSAGTFGPLIKFATYKEASDYVEATNPSLVYNTIRTVSLTTASTST